MSKKTYAGRIYVGRDEAGRQLFHWVDRFATRRERNDAVARERVRLEVEGCDCRSCALTGRYPKPARSLMPTCDAYVDEYLEEYGRSHKRSSVDTARGSLKRFREDFAGRPLDSVTRREAKEWAARVPPSRVPIVVTLFNHAIHEDDLPISRNPFRGLGRRTRGRADDPPPTEEEFALLLDKCSTLGHHAPMMRALVKFAAFTLMRPSELYELEWADIDMDRMRINVTRRVYRGSVDVPKTGEKTIALTPPARDAILGLPRDGRLVFRSRTGKRLSQAMVSIYWKEVLASADLKFSFYHATKHYGVWYLWTQLDLSPRAIAAQAGWSVRTVDRMLRVYGHGDVGALDEVDRAFEGAAVVPLRKVEGGQS